MKSYEKEVLRIKKEESDYLIPSYSEIYQKIIRDLLKPFKNKKINKIVSVDMKGLMYGPVIANKLKVGFVPVLKGGKTKNREQVLETNKFIDYSGKNKFFEMFKTSIAKNDKILLVDDWFESGNTGKEIIKLIEKLGGKVVGISVLFNQLKEEDELFFKKYNFNYLIRLKPKK